MTRHLPTRKKALARQQDSLRQLGPLASQTLLVDDVGRGLDFANTQLQTFEPRGGWVWTLDDDDLCTTTLLADILADLVPDVDLVVVQVDHGPELGTLPVQDWLWGGRVAPKVGRIGPTSIVARADLWRASRHGWGPTYTGDYGFVSEAFARASRPLWLPLVAARVQRISEGSKEDI